MKHYLYNENSNLIQTFEVFDKEAIKQGIIKYLTDHPKGMVTHEKDFNPISAKKYAGKEVLAAYECNPNNGKPSLIIQKGTKHYYLPLT